ncbi:MAG: prephenate dehydratase domain-containing protein, partial [Eubacteriales bacterium]|nr:prephenate dehydratase domain-containing protein [Eubacteriales bacterium]
MDTKKKMDAVRQSIDEVDRQIIEMFGKRMELSDQVAKIKKDGNLALTDDDREQQVIDRALAASDLAAKEETGLFMRSLMALSKLRQRKLVYGGADPELLPPSRKPQREGAVVAYQGIPGAWGEQAVAQLFKQAERVTHDSFEDVFVAVKEKKALYGVVPIENSQTGAIGEVYDLLRRYGCYIVDQTWVEVRHCLMGIPGTGLNDIREVFSHPEGFRQCEQFLRNRAWDMTSCRNTASAAEKVSKSGDKRFAAIGSVRAAELYGLEVLAPDIASDLTNRTRFIVIAAEPEYDETCDAVSVIFRTAHRSGALCEVLFPFMAGNVNLSRIESRPMTGGKYCFFCDIKGNIGDPMIATALRHAAVSCGYLEV